MRRAASGLLPGRGLRPVQRTRRPGRARPGPVRLRPAAGSPRRWRGRRPARRRSGRPAPVWGWCSRGRTAAACRGRRAGRRASRRSTRRGRESIPPPGPACKPNRWSPTDSHRYGPTTSRHRHGQASGKLAKRPGGAVRVVACTRAYPLHSGACRRWAEVPDGDIRSPTPTTAGLPIRRAHPERPPDPHSNNSSSRTDPPQGRINHHSNFIAMTILKKQTTHSIIGPAAPSNLNSPLNKSIFTSS